MAVFTHVNKLFSPSAPPEPDDAILAITRRGYDGLVAMGLDLTRFTVADTVVMKRWNAAQGGYDPSSRTHDRPTSWS